MVVPMHLRQHEDSSRQTSRRNRVVRLLQRRDSKSPNDSREKKARQDALEACMGPHMQAMWATV